MSWLAAAKRGADVKAKLVLGKIDLTKGEEARQPGGETR
jgi:hypothetical protein